MSYELDFHPVAWKEWQSLDSTIREQFKQKLVERLENPHHAPSKLSSQKARYKIKLRTIGYRLVYEVRDNELIVVVVSVGKRERNIVYKNAAQR
ncbi:MAG: type II toxin-antitoxin system RelE/ParE family toxin [Methylococcaceae bacterium]